MSFWHYILHLINTMNQPSPSSKRVLPGLSSQECLPTLSIQQCMPREGSQARKKDPYNCSKKRACLFGAIFCISLIQSTSQKRLPPAFLQDSCFLGGLPRVSIQQLCQDWICKWGQKEPHNFRQNVRIVAVTVEISSRTVCPCLQEPSGYLV